MVNWAITATRMYCDEVGRDVTIIVYKDWSAKCCFYKKYDEASIRKKDEILNKKKEGKCGRLSGERKICPRMKSYIDKLLEEERL